MLLTLARNSFNQALKLDALREMAMEIILRNSRLKRQIPPVLALILAAFDALALLAALMISLSIPDWFPILQQLPAISRIQDLPLTTHLSFSLFLSAIVMISFLNRGHYTRRMPWWGQVGQVMKVSAFVLLVDGFTHYLFKIPFSPILTATHWLLAFGAILICRRISFAIVSNMRGWKLPVILVGDQDVIMDSMYALYADGFTGYEVKKIILQTYKDEPFDLDFIPKEHPKIDLIRKMRGIQDFIRKNPDYYYIISIEGFRGDRRDSLMETLQLQHVPYAIIPPMRRMHLHGMEPHYFFGNDIMLLHQRDRISSYISAVLKRAMDIFGSAFAIPVIGVLAAMVWVNKKLNGSTAPIFYGGERIGKNGERFKCWKFNTMHVGADKMLEDLLASDPVAKSEWDQFEKLKNDPRIDSAMSGLLRKTSLDELPQLWSIFIGDMSLVGPRPILENQVVTYGEAMRYYRKVRPGLTGLWQVSGRNETSFQRRIYWDGWYVQNWTLWHDIVILFKTIRVFLLGSGAY